jgi:hypothetical protein
VIPASQAGGRVPTAMLGRAPRGVERFPTMSHRPRNKTQNIQKLSKIYRNTIQENE